MNEENKNEPKILLLSSSGDNVEEIEKKHRTDEEFEALFQLYSLWKSIPRVRILGKDKQYLSSEEVLEQAGVEDEQILELARLRTQNEFAEKYSLNIGTLSQWNKRLVDIDPLIKVKEWAVALSKNMIFAMYNHAIRKGDPQLYKLWFQVVNDWEEKARLTNEYKGVTVFNIGVAKNEKKEKIESGRQERIGSADRLGTDNQAEPSIPIPTESGN